MNVDLNTLFGQTVRINIEVAGRRFGFSCHKDKIPEALRDCERASIALAQGHSRGIVALDGIEPKHWLPIAWSYAEVWFWRAWKATFGKAAVEREVSTIREAFAPFHAVAETHERLKPLIARQNFLITDIERLRRQKKRHSHVQAQLKAVTSEILKLEGGRHE